MSVSLTYTSLVEDLPSYTERSDQVFVDQIPSFIMLAENRIAVDMKQQGFQSVVKGQFDTNSATMKKPAFWRETISFSFTNSAGIQPINLRSLEYLKQYWPNQAVSGTPRYYADYNTANFLLAAPPDSAYWFELAYYARLQPLDDDNQTNWLTANAPQVLLAATIMEAQFWLKNSAKAAEWADIYERSKSSIVMENAERISDRNEVVTRG